MVAIADFNGNDKPDYVLYNAGTRQTAIWYLNNNIFVSSSFGPTVPSGWGLRGVADFNGDGHPGLCFVQFCDSPNRNLVFVRGNVYRKRLWADHSQWLGVSGYGGL
jgi:hypothetical protein